MKFRIGLADNFHRLWRSGTVITSTFFAGVSAFGPHIRDAWGIVPADLKAILPASVQQGVAYAMFFCAVIAVRHVSVKGNDDAAN